MKGYMDVLAVAYYLVARGLIPPPQRTSHGRGYWKQKEVDEWLGYNENVPKLGSIANAAKTEMDKVRRNYKRLPGVGGIPEITRRDEI